MYNFNSFSIKKLSTVHLTSQHRHLYFIVLVESYNRSSIEENEEHHFCFVLFFFFFLKNFTVLFILADYASSRKFETVDVDEKDQARTIYCRYINFATNMIPFFLYSSSFNRW